MNLFSSPIGRLAYLGRYILPLSLLAVGGQILALARENPNGILTLSLALLALVLEVLGLVYILGFTIFPRLASVVRRYVAHKRPVRLWMVVLGMLGCNHLASAALVSAYDPRYGPDTVTIDTSTGLAWLDLTLSTNLSFRQVLAATQPGGAFDGFRYATSNEVSALLDVAGLPHARDRWYNESTDEGQAILSLISLLGATSLQDDHPETLGISGTEDRAESRAGLGLDFLVSNGLPGYEIYDGWSLGDSFSFPAVGSWLVEPIPEPSPIVFGIFTGLLLLGWRLMARRRPKNRALE